MNASREATDGSLLRRLRNGSQEAARVLYSRYAERLRALAQAKLSPKLARRIDPEDIVQSTFRCFFQAVRRGAYDLPSGEDLWSLLMVIAMNRVRIQEGFHRAAKRDVRMTTEIGSFDPTAVLRNRKNDAQSAFLRAVIRESLEKLPPHFRTVIQLRMEGREVTEIAQITVRSKRTVERILHDALKQLRILLDEEESHDDTPASAEMAGDR